jgi:membrane protein
VPRALRAIVERFAEVGGVERAMVLAAQAFATFIPMLVVVVSLVPGSDANGFGDRVVDRFDLTGSVADSVRALFAPAGEVTSGITVLGALLVSASAFTFARRMQGLYQLSWRLPALPWRASWRPLVWVVIAMAYFALVPLLRGVDPGHRLLIGGASFALWLITPGFLLGGRVPWRALVPTALLTAVSMALMSAVSTIYMSRAITESTEQYGPIGTAFAVMSWLVAVGFIIVAAAVVGAVWGERAGYGRAA